jgi:hypothetical protein
MPTSTDDGLYYETRGSGAKTLIIPNGVCLMNDLQRLAVGRTIIAYDLRNRGRSDAVGDPAKLVRGILNDVDDLDQIRGTSAWSEVFKKLAELQKEITSKDPVEPLPQLFGAFTAVKIDGPV